MKTSVIVTCYNHEKYVVQCLDSIVCNRIPKLELIICDDCSTDNSVENVERWLIRNSSRFERFQFIKHQKNKGVAASLNELINYSSGDIISPLASDDYYLPNTLSKRRDFFKKNKKLMGAFSDGVAVGLENQVFSKSLVDSSNLKRLNHNDLGFHEQVLFKWAEPINLQCWRRDAFKMHGGGFEFEDVFCEDLNFALWALSENSFGYIDSICYAYRCRSWPQTTPGDLKTKWSQMAYLYKKYSVMFNLKTRDSMISRSNWLLSLAEGKSEEAEIFSRQFNVSVIGLQKNIEKVKKPFLERVFNYIKK